jgi:hypothetical protein
MFLLSANLNFLLMTSKRKRKCLNLLFKSVVFCAFHFNFSLRIAVQGKKSSFSLHFVFAWVSFPCISLTINNVYNFISSIFSTYFHLHCTQSFPSTKTEVHIFVHHPGEFLYQIFIGVLAFFNFLYFPARKINIFHFFKLICSIHDCFGRSKIYAKSVTAFA